MNKAASSSPIHTPAKRLKPDPSEAEPEDPVHDKDTGVSRGYVPVGDQARSVVTGRCVDVMGRGGVEDGEEGEGQGGGGLARGRVHGGEGGSGASVGVGTEPMNGVLVSVNDCGLYLGDDAAAQSLQRLREKRIGLIINTSAECQNYFFQQDVQPPLRYINLNIPYNSNGWEDDAQIDFDMLTNEIETFLAPKEEGEEEEGGRESTSHHNVLVHCVHGTHESVAVCLAYIMKSCASSLYDSFELMADTLGALPPAGPALKLKLSTGVVNQLGEFEKSLFSLQNPTLSIADVRRSECKLWTDS
eukprot:Nk52_evm8s211 gene=Nk52_evmTU8s211